MPVLLGQAAELGPQLGQRDYIAAGDVPVIGEVRDLADYLKATPPSEGSSGVLYPGEIEHRTEMDRRVCFLDMVDRSFFRPSRSGIESTKGAVRRAPKGRRRRHFPVSSGASLKSNLIR